MNRYSVRLAFISLVGAVVSGYLVFHYAEMRSGVSVEPSFCSISPAFDCDRVAKSEYSHFLGIPVASYGLVYYLGFLTYLLLGLRGAEPADSPEAAARRRRLSAAHFFISSLSLPITVALFLISKLLIGALCLMCMVLYAVNIALFAVSACAPDRERQGLKTWLAGFAEAVSVVNPASTAAIPRTILILFLSLEISFALRLPILFRDYWILPNAAKLQDRAVLMVGLKKWRDMPSVKLPEFSDKEGFTLDVAYGNPQAKVTLVEFSDLECPACHNMAPFVESALERYKDKVRFVFKHFPLDMACNSLIQVEKHRYACQAARMAICAGTEGRDALWKFVSAAFRLTTVDTEHLSAIPAEIKLDRDRFQKCMTTDESLARVKADVQLGLDLGVYSTPTIYVNGKALQGPGKFLPGVLGLIIEETEKGVPLTN